MTHEVTIKQIREVKNSKQLVATADVNIDSIIHKGFKILRSAEHNSYWVANPQSEVNGKFYEVIEFLDWELEQDVKARIVSAYQKILQSRTVIPEMAE